MPLHHVVWEKALRKNGFYEPFSWDYFTTLGGLGLADTEHLVETFGYELNPEAIAEEKEEGMRQIAGGIQAKPEIMAIAQEAHSANIPISIATGSPSETIFPLLQQIDPNRIFSIMVAAIM